MNGSTRGIDLPKRGLPAIPSLPKVAMPLLKVRRWPNPCACLCSGCWAMLCATCSETQADSCGSPGRTTPWPSLPRHYRSLLASGSEPGRPARAGNGLDPGRARHPRLYREVAATRHAGRAAARDRTAEPAGAALHGLERRDRVAVRMPLLLGAALAYATGLISDDPTGAAPFASAPAGIAWSAAPASSSARSCSCA